MKYIYFICTLAGLAAVLSCSKMNDLHDKYLDGEVVYAAKVDTVSYGAGRNRIGLDIVITSQRIESLRIYWNAYADSTDLSIGNQVGVFHKMIDNMEENSHIFQIVSFDGFGNRSLPFEVSGSAYGDRFQSRISNRTTRSVYAGDAGLSIDWGAAPDNAVCSDLAYTDRNGRERSLRIPASESSTLVADWASDLRYRTLFLPEPTAIDTFYTDWRTVSQVPFKYATTGWTADCRNGNHDWGSQGGQPDKVLDGDRITGWHSRVGAPLPQCFVLDMQESRPVDHIVLWHHPDAIASNWIYFKTIEVYLSDTPVTPDEYQASWGAPVARYEYPGGINGFPIQFNPDSRGRYMVLYFPNSSSNTYISFTELDVYRE